jgi:hypothetical protein
LLMKRPVGWSYFLPLGNEICVVEAIVKDYVKRRRLENLSVCSLMTSWGHHLYMSAT